jgi:hypothetical protein
VNGLDAGDPDADRIAAEHAELGLDDAAYLLGALDPVSQARFEQHLLDCPACQDSVAELSDLPGLLGRLTTAEVEALDDPADREVPATLMPGLLDRVRAERRRRVWRARATGFAVACLLVLLAGVGVRAWSESGRPQPVAMTAVGSNHGAVRATVTLTGSGTATRIRLDCGYVAGSGFRYPATPAPSYRMVALNRSGQLRDLGSWTAQDGEDVELVRDSPWDRKNLSQIQVTDLSGATVLQLSL